VSFRKICPISTISCPFISASATVCEASLSSMVIRSNDRRRFCDGDNYDDCPLFLSKMLRVGESRA
jgi:hypothetical protein